MIRNLAVVLLLVSASVPGLAKEKYQHPGPIYLDHGGEKWAQKTLKKLSLDEKVGQLFMVWVRAEFLNVNSPEYLQLRDTMSKYHVGSFAMTVPWEPPFLYRSEPYEAAELLNRLQQDSKLPLLFAADFERGVTMRLRGSTPFPHAMAFGAAGKEEYAKAFGRITAEESRAVGVHWNFFPDADVNSNPANPIINTRSFGEDPGQVGDLVAAYIRGARAGGMMTTAKHFPGHGDTATDSHLSVAQVTGDRARLNSVELPPFRKAIAAGVDSVMVAHVTVPALEADPNRVATTSPAIVSDLLKHELGFQGIVVTDALDMAGLTRLYAANIGRAAVDAFKAGSDLLLIPADLEASYNAVLEAARSGNLRRTPAPRRLVVGISRQHRFAQGHFSLKLPLLNDPVSLNDAVRDWARQDSNSWARRIMSPLLEPAELRARAGERTAPRIGSDLPRPGRGVTLAAVKVHQEERHFGTRGGLHVTDITDEVAAIVRDSGVVHANRLRLLCCTRPAASA